VLTCFIYVAEIRTVSSTIVSKWGIGFEHMTWNVGLDIPVVFVCANFADSRQRFEETQPQRAKDWPCISFDAIRKRRTIQALDVGHWVRLLLYGGLKETDVHASGSQQYEAQGWMIDIKKSGNRNDELATLDVHMLS
jgi:hypothetical protein